MEPTVDRAVPRVTAADILTLLGSSAEHPVLYLSYGDDDAELDVWDAGLVPQEDIVLTRATAVDLLGEEPGSEAVAASLSEVQEAVDRMVSARDV